MEAARRVSFPWLPIDDNGCRRARCPGSFGLWTWGTRFQAADPCLAKASRGRSAGRSLFSGAHGDGLWISRNGNRFGARAARSAQRQYVTRGDLFRGSAERERNDGEPAATPGKHNYCASASDTVAVGSRGSRTADVRAGGRPPGGQTVSTRHRVSIQPKHRHKTHQRELREDTMTLRNGPNPGLDPPIQPPLKQPRQPPHQVFASLSSSLPHLWPNRPTHNHQQRLRRAALPAAGSIPCSEQHALRQAGTPYASAFRHQASGETFPTWLECPWPPFVRPFYANLGVFFRQ